MRLYTEQEERERVRRLMEQPNAVFVFGSNLAGRHGKGAAKDALRMYGAECGLGSGPMGRCYAIPTKGFDLHTLTVGSIAAHVTTFRHHAASQPQSAFVVTKIGCGLAGYAEEEIAPLFHGAPSNVHLPLGWAELIEAASKEDPSA